MKARRNDEVARTLVRAFEQHRRFHFHELVRVHVAMDRLHDAMPELQGLRQLGPPDIEIPILQAQRLICVHVVLDFERRGLGFRDDLQVAGHYLDLARRHLWVLGPARPAGDLAFYANDVFVSDFGFADRSDHDLHQAPPVAQVDECNAAVVAASRDPAVQLDLSAVRAPGSPSGTTSTSAGGLAMTSTPVAAISSVTRSRPLAKPTAAVGGQPSASARPSYRPPPPSASCCPAAPLGKNSNTVRV